MNHHWVVNRRRIDWAEEVDLGETWSSDAVVLATVSLASQYIQKSKQWQLTPDIWVCDKDLL